MAQPGSAGPRDPETPGARAAPAGMPEKKREGKGGKGKKGRGAGRKAAAPAEGAAGEGVSAVPPKLKALKNQESTVGQTLVLRCEASSEYPTLRFKWLKDGKEITKKNKSQNVKISKKQKKYSELHISRASLTDAGEYTCKVSSKLGNDSTKASVTITDINATSTSTTGTSHLTKCDIKQKAFCVNGGECYMVKDLPNPPRYLCR
ncbi:pro-neuregulin-1, membrane-bound isoform isoform X5 [Emydura macquarii macquarii]|uniref:pro-neuregulin-1, membrane-bound isoform isoform X5 n=1 Tax=Emydura macquarii macquarii TaxID=1129001 RepID=UPI00352A8E76